MSRATAAETCIPQLPGMLKSSKSLASSVHLASAPLKRHISRVPKRKSTKRTTVAKSAATVLSSESAVEAAGTTPIPQGTKDTPAAATFSASDGSAETKACTEFESLNELSFICVEPDETKHMIADIAERSLVLNTDIAERSLQILGLQLKDVVHSNLATSSWFTLDYHEFDDFFKDRNSHMTSSAVAAEATTPLNAAPSINYNDEFGGAIAGVCSSNKPLQQENCEGSKVVLEELLETEDVSEEKDDSLNGSTMPKKLETNGVVKQAFENLMHEAVHGISAAWSGSCRGIKFLLPVIVLVLFTVLLCVENLIEDELSMLPPPS